MRCHLLLVSEKKIKILRTAFATKKSSIVGGATITFCTQTAHITNICMKSGLIIFNTLAVTLRTDDAGCRTQDTGRRIQDTGRMTLSPTTRYLSSQVS